MCKKGWVYTMSALNKVTVEDIEVRGKRVLVRCDFNVPLKEGKITIEEGKEYDGEVKSLTDFGAFVDIGGVDGLVHISELSWNKIKHPSEVCAVGDVMDVYIKEINPETKKISLGYRKAEDNPWANVKYQVGDEVTGTVVSMKPFGAFVELDNGLEALVHISNITMRRIQKPQDALEMGQEVTAKVVEVDLDKKRIELSIRELEGKDVVEETTEAETTVEA